MGQRLCSCNIPNSPSRYTNLSMSFNTSEVIIPDEVIRYEETSQTVFNFENLNCITHEDNICRIDDYDAA